MLGSTYDHKNLEWEPNENSGEYLLQRALQIVDKPISVLNHIAGVRPTVKDRRPVLGFSAQSKRVAMFNGLGTKGVMLGPWFSEEMYKYLESPGYKIEKEVSIERFL